MYISTHVIDLVMPCLQYKFHGDDFSFIYSQYVVVEVCVYTGVCPLYVRITDDPNSVCRQTDFIAPIPA